MQGLKKNYELNSSTWH